MTKQQAIDYIRRCEEDEGPESYDEAAEIFEAIFGRAADRDDGSQLELWSQACAAVS